MKANSSPRQKRGSLRDLEDRYRSLIEHMQAGVVVHAPDTRVVFANEQACALLGLTLDQMKGRAAVDPAWRFVREDEAPVPLDRYPVNRVLATREPLRNLVAGIDQPGGARVWVLVNAFPGFDASGGLREIVVTFVDITARRQAEMASAASEERYRALFGSSPAGIAVIGADGRLQEANRAVCQMLGYTVSSEALHLPAVQLVAPDDRERAAANMQARLRGEDLGLREYRLLRKDGSSFPAVLSGAPLHDAGGAICGYITVVRDITREKQDEALRARRRAFDGSMIGALTRFATCRSDSVDAAMTESLQALATEMGADHAAVVVFSSDLVVSSGAFEWRAPKGDAAGGRRAAPDAFPWSLAELRAGKTVQIDAQHPYPTEAMSDRRTAEREGASASLAIPLVGGNGAALGALGLFRRGDARPWSEEEVAHVTMMAGVVAGFLERVASEAETERVAALDELVTRILGRVTACSDEELDAVVTHALEKVGTFIGADHGCLMTGLGDGTYSVTHEWCGAGVAPCGAELQRVPVDQMWNHTPLVAGETVVVDRLEDLAPDSERRRFLAHRGAHAILATPTTFSDGRFNGALEFRRHASEQPWRRRDGATVRMLGNALAGALDRRRAEAARRDSDAKFAAFMCNLPAAAFVTDEAGRTLFMNAYSQRVLGCDDWEGKSVHALAGDDAGNRMEADDRKALAEGPLKVRETFLDSHGVPRTFETIKFPIHLTPATTLLGGIAIDVTERQQAETERERLWQQLLQAQKMEAVGRLAGGIAHDFNNMLSVIIGRAQMVLESLPPHDEACEDVESILSAGQKSADLTRQLLAFGRKQTIRPRVLDINETVGGMLRMLKRLISEEIGLVWRPGAGVWPVRLDPAQLDQVLANLAVNARDAISGSGKVTIETANVRVGQAADAAPDFISPGEYVLLSVNDTGAGMPPEVRARAFEPFFTTKEAGVGTGLGLATVYGIVKQNDGFVILDSAPGQGTTVRIYLPRCHDAVPAAQLEKTAQPASGDETILLVDDSAGVRHSTHRLLTSLGYAVVVAEDAEEALRLVREEKRKVDLLVTDVVLPKMNGRELAERVEACQPDIRCLFMSGYNADAVALHGVLETEAHFVQKPFSIGSLAAAVRDALGPAHQRRASGRAARL